MRQTYNKEKKILRISTTLPSISIENGYTSLVDGNCLVLVIEGVDIDSTFLNHSEEIYEKVVNEPGEVVSLRRELEGIHILLVPQTDYAIVFPTTPILIPVLENCYPFKSGERYICQSGNYLIVPDGRGQLLDCLNLFKVDKEIISKFEEEPRGLRYLESELLLPYYRELAITMSITNMDMIYGTSSEGK